MEKSPLAVAEVVVTHAETGLKIWLTPEMAAGHGLQGGQLVGLEQGYDLLREQLRQSVRALDEVVLRMRTERTAD